MLTNGLLVIALLAAAWNIATDWASTLIKVTHQLEDKDAAKLSMPFDKLMATLVQRPLHNETNKL